MAAAKDTATIATLTTKLVALSVQFDGAIKEISELKSRFDIFQNNFIRSDVYNIKHEELVRQVATNTNDIKHLNDNQSRNVSWVWPLVTFLLGGILLFLINYAITH